MGREVIRGDDSENLNGHPASWPTRHTYHIWWQLRQENASLSQQKSKTTIKNRYRSNNDPLLGFSRHHGALLIYQRSNILCKVHKQAYKVDNIVSYNLVHYSEKNSGYLFQVLYIIRITGKISPKEANLCWQACIFVLQGCKKQWTVRLVYSFLLLFYSTSKPRKTELIIVGKKQVEVIRYLAKLPPMFKIYYIYSLRSF